MEREIGKSVILLIFFFRMFLPNENKMVFLHTTLRVVCLFLLSKRTRKGRIQSFLKIYKTKNNGNDRKRKFEDHQ